MSCLVCVLLHIVAVGLTVGQSTCSVDAEQTKLDVILQRVTTIASRTHSCQNTRTHEESFGNSLSAVNLDLGFSYLIIRNQKKTWTEALAACEERGYFLASIDSQAEHDYIVFTLILSDSALKAVNGLWLGGTDLGHEGCWLWARPKVRKIDAGYTKWDNRNNNGGQHCARLWKDQQYDWDDYQCNRKSPFICKRPLHPTFQSPTSQDRNYLSTSLC